MRKVLAAVFGLLVTAGLLMAGEVILVRYDKDKKEVTVKDGDKEKTYKITDKTTVYLPNKDGDIQEVRFDKDGRAEQRFSNTKAAGKLRLWIDTEKDTVTSIKFRMK